MTGGFEHITSSKSIENHLEVLPQAHSSIWPHRACSLGIYRIVSQTDVLALPSLFSPCARSVIFLHWSGRIPAHPQGYCFSPVSSVFSQADSDVLSQTLPIIWLGSSSWTRNPYREYDKCTEEINRPPRSMFVKYLSFLVLLQFLKSAGLRTSPRVSW